MKSTLMAAVATLAFSGAGVALADDGHARHGHHGPNAAAPSAGGSAVQPNADQRQQRMNERHAKMAERHAQMADRHARMGGAQRDVQPNNATPRGGDNASPRGNHEHRHDGRGPRRG